MGPRAAGPGLPGEHELRAGAAGADARGPAGPAHGAGAVRRRRRGRPRRRRGALRGGRPRAGALGAGAAGAPRRRRLPGRRAGRPRDPGSLMPVALVTGASRGIGAACARALAADGFDVGVGYASGAEGAAVTVASVEAAGRRAVAHGADVADEAQAAGLVEAVEEALGPLDALVLNAGITRDGLAVRMSADDWGAVLDTNLSGAFYTARPALRGMLRRRAGSIVAV